MSRRFLFLFAMLVLVAVSYNTGVQAAEQEHCCWEHSWDDVTLIVPTIQEHPWDDVTLIVPTIQEHPWQDSK